MKVGIIGAGALGSVYGSLLYQNGENVNIYENDDNIVEKIKSNGIQIKQPNDVKEFIDVPITNNPVTVSPVDVVFVFTKSFDTASAIEDADPMINEGTYVVTLQNGIRNMDKINKYMPRDRIFGGYTRVGVNKISPGHVRFIGANETVIGGTEYKIAQDIAEMLSLSGIPTTVVNDPLPYIWKKQFHNVARKPIAALTELRNGPQLEYKETQSIAERLITEAIIVAEKKEIKILEEDPVNSFLQSSRPDRYYKKSSILEDVEQERRTEIEDINGAIVQYGEEEDVDVPYNRLVTNLVKAKEKSYLNQNIDNGS